MADNVNLPGTGSNIATDDVGGNHFQRIKLDIGGDGLSTPVVGSLPVSATDLDIRNLSPGQDVVRLGDGVDLVNITAAGELVVLATAQPGTDIGDVTVNNGSGAAAVNIQDGVNSLTVDGAVTAHAGTNLNTSALALEAGGNLAGIRTAVELIDNTVYTEGDVDTTITGVPALWEDTGNTLRAISASTPLPVAIISGAGSGGTAIQDGAVFTPDTTSLTPVGGYRDDTSPAQVIEGDAASARITQFRAIHVNLRDASGNEVAVGGGTQYTEGDTDATITGTAMLLEGAANTLVPAQGTVADGLLVNLGVNNDVVVSGTVTANLAAGTNNIGDVDVLTLPAIPTGANTIGSIASITTSMVPGTGATNLGKAIDSAAGATDTGVAALAIRDDATSTLTPIEGDYIPLRVNSRGALWIDLETRLDSTNDSVTIGAALPAGTNNIGDIDVLTVPAPLSTTGGGTEAAALRVTLANDSTGLVSVDDNGGSLTVDGTITANAGTGTFTVQDNASLVDDAAFTPATSRVVMAGFEADETSTDSIDEGDAGAARITLDRKQIVTSQPHTQGGLTIFRTLDLDETEEEVKATAGQVYGCWFTNTATATRWLKFYNATAATVVVGTTTPVITIGLPGNSSDDISGYFGSDGNGISFSTAITIAATTGVADADTGAPGVNDVIVNLFFK